MKNLLAVERLREVGGCDILALRDEDRLEEADSALFEGDHLQLTIRFPGQSGRLLDR